MLTVGLEDYDYASSNDWVIERPKQADDVDQGNGTTQAKELQTLSKTALAVKDAARDAYAYGGVGQARDPSNASSVSQNANPTASFSAYKKDDSISSKYNKENNNLNGYYADGKGGHLATSSDGSIKKYDSVSKSWQTLSESDSNKIKSQMGLTENNQRDFSGFKTNEKALSDYADKGILDYLSDGKGGHVALYKSGAAAEYKNGKWTDLSEIDAQSVRDQHPLTPDTSTEIKAPVKTEEKKTEEEYIEKMNDTARTYESRMGTIDGKPFGVHTATESHLDQVKTQADLEKAMLKDPAIDQKMLDDLKLDPKEVITNHEMQEKAKELASSLTGGFLFTSKGNSDAFFDSHSAFEKARQAAEEGRSDEANQLFKDAFQGTLLQNYKDMSSEGIASTKSSDDYQKASAQEQQAMIDSARESAGKWAYVASADFASAYDSDRTAVLALNQAKMQEQGSYSAREASSFAKDMYSVKFTNAESSPLSSRASSDLSRQMRQMEAINTKINTGYKSDQYSAGDVHFLQQAYQRIKMLESNGMANTRYLSGEVSSIIDLYKQI